MAQQHDRADDQGDDKHEYVKETSANEVTPLPASSCTHVQCCLRVRCTLFSSLSVCIIARAHALHAHDSATPSDPTYSLSMPNADVARFLSSCTTKPQERAKRLLGRGTEGTLDSRNLASENPLLVVVVAQVMTVAAMVAVAAVVAVVVMQQAVAAGRRGTHTVNIIERLRA
jgi:hypothetical protein